MAETESPRRGSAVIHLRVDRELHDQVREYAERTRRSMNAAACVLLESALAAESRKATRR